MGDVKFSEFDPKSKLSRANLRLQTSFQVFISQDDCEWEVVSDLIKDKCIKLLIENLKQRKYRDKKQDKIFCLEGKTKHQVFSSSDLEFSLVKTPWDSNTLTQPGHDSATLTSKTLHLNLFLEAYQPNDANFSDILSVEAVDQEPDNRS